MQFEDFLVQHHVKVRAVDQFDGFEVGVALPEDWTPFDSFEPTGGARIWAWRNDPRRSVFCANAVLVLQKFDKALDVETVFAVTCDRQQRSVPGSREQHRELINAVEGPGSAGTLVLEIDHEIGAVNSVSHARVLTTDEETLVAQLTVSALNDKPVDSARIRLSAVADIAPTLGHQGGQPVSAPVTHR